MTTMTTVMTVMMMMTHHHHFQTKHQTNAKCHRTVEYRDQTATERPARPRVSVPAICVNTRSYVFVYVKSIKRTAPASRWSRIPANRSPPSLKGSSCSWGESSTLRFVFWFLSLFFWRILKWYNIPCFEFNFYVTNFSIGDMCTCQSDTGRPAVCPPQHQKWTPPGQTSSGLWLW